LKALRSELPSVIVDDDASVCRALARLLRASGFAPLTYSSAEAFLQNRPRVIVDCMILDIHLGGMSGFELQKQLAAAGSVPPIIFITADEDPDNSELARQAGCVACFRKPFPGHKLMETIRSAVAEKNTH
jgi:FixJ family two-component response regulator